MVEAGVFLCGHTHIPYDRTLPSLRHVVNAGSVDQSTDDDPRTRYVELTMAGGELEVSIHRVAYDAERIAQAIENSDMHNEYARMLRDGRG